MKSKFLILGLIFLVLSIFLFIGLFGISGKITLKEGSCEKSYKHYYIEPVISNYLECRIQRPCGTGQALTIRNVKVDIIQCLCLNRNENKDNVINIMKDILINYHKVKDVDKYPSIDDVNYICDKEARKIYRI